MKYIAYYRVSTAKQGSDGLGMEAQRKAVETFCRPIASFTEVESGKRADRPQLALAIDACKREGATLVIAKLDRLARNVAFTAALMEAGIEFVACDNPNASRLTVHILAAIAEDEARRTSERTKAALAVAKQRGKQLGKPENLDTAARCKGTAANVASAAAHHAKVAGMAKGLRDSGCTLAAIAETMTGAGLRTRRGKPWTPTAVMRLLA